MLAIHSMPHARHLYVMVRVTGVVRLKVTVVGSPRTPQCGQYDCLRSPSVGRQDIETPGRDRMYRLEDASATRQRLTGASRLGTFGRTLDAPCRRKDCNV